MERAKKEALVAELHEAFTSANLVVLTHQQGLTVAESSHLRQQMRDAGARFKVTKNRLAKRALEGTRFDHLSDRFTGPTAVAFSQDPVAAARVAVDFGKANPKLQILAGGLDGKELQANDVAALAALPSLDVLRGRLVGLLQAPAGKLVGVMQAPAGQLARVLAAYGKS